MLHAGASQLRLRKDKARSPGKRMQPAANVCHIPCCAAAAAAPLLTAPKFCASSPLGCCWAARAKAAKPPPPTALRSAPPRLSSPPCHGPPSLAALFVNSRPGWQREADGGGGGATRQAAIPSGEEGGPFSRRHQRGRRVGSGCPTAQPRPLPLASAWPKESYPSLATGWGWVSNAKEGWSGVDARRPPPGAEANSGRLKSMPVKRSLMAFRGSPGDECQ